MKLSEMTWEEVRDLDPSTTIAMLPVGAVEAHGPHLPVTTDVVISEAMAERAAAKLAARAHRVLVLPALVYTSAEFASSFPGTISIRNETVSAVLQDVARSLQSQGFRTLVLANSHLDPGHIASIGSAVAVIRETLPLRVVFPDITKRPWGGRLTEEFKSGACHAGRYETSIVLAARPELVRESIRSALVSNPASLLMAIREGKTTFEEAGGERAYFGFPDEATAEEGHATIEVLGSILEEATVAALASRD